MKYILLRLVPVGGLLSINASTPVFRGSYNGDVNTISKSGLYVLGPQATNHASLSAYQLLNITVSLDGAYKIMTCYSNSAKVSKVRWKFESYDTGWG